MQRSIGYLSIINGTMIFYMFAKAIGLGGIYIPIIMVIGAMLLLLLGYLDFKYVMQKEQKIIHDKVPQISELLDRKND